MINIKCIGTDKIKCKILKKYFYLRLNRVDSNYFTNKY